MDPLQLITAGGVMAGLGFILSVVLVVANKKLHVEEDPRIDVVEEMLPGANCGACGNPGCRAFAELVVEGMASPAQCPVNPSEVTEEIGEFLGVDIGSSEKRVARLACAGGDNVARMMAEYQGIQSCRAAVLIAGGGKGCAWGCIRLGDCVEICPFDAIIPDKHKLPVVDVYKCTACGQCVTACPKNLFSIHPVTHKLFVTCKSQAFGKQAKSECAVACIGCGLCAKDAEEGVVDMYGKLPVVNYKENEKASMDAIQRCPTGAIVWIEGDKIITGEKAPEITNDEPLPIG